MTERPRQDVSDKFCWWCSQCKTRKSIREGSFFQKSRLELKKWLLLLFLWAKDDPVTSVAQIMEISRPSAIDAFQWLREVCSSKLLQNLGGPGNIVQIDESLFRHKPKVINIDSMCRDFLKYSIYYSITGEGQQLKNSGYSDWLMFLMSLLWDIWK